MTHIAFESPRQRACRLHVTLSAIYQALRAGRIQGAHLDGRGRWRIPTPATQPAPIRDFKAAAAADDSEE
jgi:hypothetical protein